MEPILPFTGWLSIQYMRSIEIQNLKHKLSRINLFNTPQPLNLPGKKPTKILTPHIEPHNCIRICGVKTNWIVWEQVYADTMEHVGSFGECLNCASEEGFCDYPDAGWGVYEPTFDESEHAYEIAKKWFNKEITQEECNKQRYAVPERPLVFCTPWKR